MKDAKNKSLKNRTSKGRVAKDDMSAKKNEEISIAEERIATISLAEDFRNSILIVSVLINLFILISWVMIQMTTQYDHALASFLFSR